MTTANYANVDICEDSPYACTSTKLCSKMMFSDTLEKAWTRFTLNIWALQNSPSPNEILIKGYRFADIKTSAQALHKTHACISLKKRSYGLVCNLGKQIAETKVFEPSNESPRYSLSMGAPSTTRPRLRRLSLIHI